MKKITKHNITDKITISPIDSTIKFGLSQTDKIEPKLIQAPDYTDYDKILYNSQLDNYLIEQPLDIKNKIYRRIGGVQELLKLREKNGLNTSYKIDDLPIEHIEQVKTPKEQYQSIYDIPIYIGFSQGQTGKDLLKDNKTIEIGKNNFDGQTKLGEYVVNTKKMHIKNNIDNDSQKKTLSHELQHYMQFISPKPNINLDEYFKKGKTYLYNIDEIEARAAEALYLWQQKNQKILTTPTDLENLLNDKEIFRDIDKYRKEQFRKIIPTLVKNEEQPKTLWG